MNENDTTQVVGERDAQHMLGLHRRRARQEPPSGTRRVVHVGVVLATAMALSCGNGGVAMGDAGGDSGRLPNGTFCDRLQREMTVSTGEQITLCSPDAPEDSPCFIGPTQLNPGACRSVNRFNPTVLGPYVASNRVPKLCWVPPPPLDNTSRGKGPTCYDDLISMGGSQQCGTNGRDGTFCLYDPDHENGRCMPLPCN